ncbi:hypothetical protein [Halovivax cerinus]|uniref:Small CPxCG-related zinc finger protein n=1 Tax=Halovivax cerinus TaxID=1487865 RepID=A0ABD5NSI1_9EURY|nr:hypothetical protein [Halovivax cerinus]
MGRYEFDEPGPDDPCPRCGQDLQKTYWAYVRTAHEGPLSYRYEDTEKRLCVDCIAAIGMLELAMDGAAGGGQEPV